MPNYAKTDHFTKDENDFWAKFCACAGQEFQTLTGLNFTFRVKGNEIFFDRKVKSITRSTIVRAYQQTKQLLAKKTPITRTKQISAFGASYLLPVFLKIGVLKATSVKNWPSKAKAEADGSPSLFPNS
jgi:hypothetical protein